MELGSNRTPAPPEQGRHWGVQGWRRRCETGTPHIHKHRFSIAKALRTNPENSAKEGGASVSLPQSRSLGEQV